MAATATTPSGWIGDSFIRNSGFLEVADTRDVILVFPQARARPGHLPRCGPSPPLATTTVAGTGGATWGRHRGWPTVSGPAPDHTVLAATKAGRQMRGVAAMVERVAGIPL